jgi:hypothetical protein
MFMRRNAFVLVAIPISLTLSACGYSHKKNPQSAPFFQPAGEDGNSPETRGSGGSAPSKRDDKQKPIHDPTFKTRTKTEIPVSVNPDEFGVRRNMSASSRARDAIIQPVTAELGAQLDFLVDINNWYIPKCSSLTEIGTLTISSIRDNELNQCGPLENEKCRTAVFQMYLGGTDASARFFVQSPELSLSELQIDSPIIFDTITIPQDRHVLQLSDSNTGPRVTVYAYCQSPLPSDYSTSIVIEYGLSD